MNIFEIGYNEEEKQKEKEKTEEIVPNLKEIEKIDQLLKLNDK